MTTPTTDQTEDQTSTPEGEGATDQGKGKAGQDAARYRTRLRGVEQERDALAQRVARLQTAEVHRLAASRMADPDDLAVHGVQVVDLLDDDGEVDAAEVEAAVDDLLTKRPRLSADYQPDADDLDGGARTSVRGGGASWGSVISGGRR